MIEFSSLCLKSFTRCALFLKNVYIDTGNTNKACCSTTKNTDFAKLVSYNVFLIRNAVHFNDINATFIISNTIVADLLHAKLCWTLYNIKIIQSRICTYYSSLAEAGISLVMMQKPLSSYLLLKDYRQASSSNEKGSTVSNFQLLGILYKSIKQCTLLNVTFSTNMWSYFMLSW